MPRKKAATKRTATKKTAEPAPAVWVEIWDLVEWEDNPRKNDAAVPEIAASIQRFGFSSPIVARSEDGMIIAGHTRLKAARELGLEKVPVRWMDLSREEAIALALADNKLGEIAYWSDELQGLMSSLAEEDGVDLSGLGWSDDELSDLVSAAPMFLGDDKVRDDVARTNNNMQKADGNSSGHRITVIGDLRCILHAKIYAALVAHCNQYDDTQTALSTLLGDALKIDREEWQREQVG